MRPYFREVLKALPYLGRSGRVLYRRPPKAILVGYLIEMPPGGPRLRAIRFPLYEQSDIVHLDYSPVLAQFDADGREPDHAKWAAMRSRSEPLSAEELQALRPRRMSGDAERVLASQLIARIRQDEALLDLRQDPRQFAEDLRPRAQQNPRWKKTLALTLVLLGELPEAERLIAELFRQSSSQFTELEKSDLEETLRSIRTGHTAAQNYRLDVIRQMRDKFSISD